MTEETFRRDAFGVVASFLEAGLCFCFYQDELEHAKQTDQLTCDVTARSRLPLSVSNLLACVRQRHTSVGLF